MFFEILFRMATFKYKMTPSAIVIFSLYVQKGFFLLLGTVYISSFE